MDTPRTRREHEVWQACDDLWALSANLEALKGDHIRDRLLSLGFKKGSPNEIYKYRTTWKESRGISEKTLIEAGQQTDPVSRAVSLVYEQIQQDTQQKIAAIQTDTCAQVEKLRQHNQELLLTCESTLQEHEGLKLAHETLRTALEKEQTHARELKLKLEGCELLLSELKNTYTIQIDKLERKLKDQGFAFSEELNNHKLETRIERDKRVKLETDNQRLTRELERFRKRQEISLQKEMQKIAKSIQTLRVTLKKPPPKKNRHSKTKISSRQSQAVELSD